MDLIGFAESNILQRLEGAVAMDRVGCDCWVGSILKILRQHMGG